MGVFRTKTRPGRLAALDVLLLALEPELLSRRDGPFADAPVVDVGIGAHPHTTRELAERLDVPVVGRDLDPEVVARARLEAPELTVEVGGFDVPPGARLVRALNVLRDYAALDVPAAHEAMGAGLLEGGLVVEGSCGPYGEVGTVHLLRRRHALVREALLMWTDGTRGTAPMLFRDRLPRDLRSAPRDHALFRLLARWTEAFEAVGPVADRLSASVRALDDPALTVVATHAVRWAPAGGVPSGQEGR